MVRAFAGRKLAAAALLAAAGPAAPSGNAPPDAGSNRAPELVVNFVRQGGSAREELLSCGLTGIAAVEDFLAAPGRVDEGALPGLLEQLGHEKYELRRQATEQLSLLPQSALPLLQGLAGTNSDPEIRMRIEEVTRNIRAGDARVRSLPPLLDEMYNQHAEQVLRQRLPAVAKNPGDMRAVHALNRVQFDRAWQLLESAPKDEQLTYLLLKVYCFDAGKAETKLKVYAAADILRVAAMTWWPIEIEPLEKDGAYGWTTRAGSVEGNVATSVMRFSVKMPDFGNIGERGQWVHLYRWSEIAYIFQFPPDLGRNVVGYVQLDRAPPQVTGWMARLAGDAPAGEPERRCATLRGFPATARLPLVHITRDEMYGWNGGRPYLWAKPLFPEKLVNRVKFVENKYPAPRIDPLPAPGDDK
jgi:hypothetical protein